MTRDDILGAFTALSTRLESRGLRAELAIMGGAAMVLRYSAREATKDVDAVFLSPTPAALRELAEEVASVRGLRRDWLNDGAKGFLEGLSDAKRLLGTLTGDRESIWDQVEPYLVRGRELSAGYALDDLWEQRDGTS